MWKHMLSSLVHFRANSITVPSLQNSVELHQDAIHRLLPRHTFWKKPKTGSLEGDGWLNALLQERAHWKEMDQNCLGKAPVPWGAASSTGYTVTLLFYCNIPLPRRGRYPTTSPKQVVCKESLGTDLCYRVITKALHRGYTNNAPQVAHSILQGYQSKSSHVFPQLNQWPWKQFQSSVLNYDDNQIFKRHSCK